MFLNIRYLISWKWYLLCINGSILCL